MNSSRTLRLAVVIDAGKKTKDFFIAHALGTALGVPYELVPASDGEFGVLLPDGNWTGIMGMIVKGHADLGIKVVPTEERSKAVTFSYPQYYGQITFITQKPEIADRTFAFVHPFSGGVWLALISTFLAVSVLIYIILRRRYKYHAVVFNMIQSLLRQSWRLHTTGYVEKLAETIWFIGTMLLAYCYTGVLLSFLSFPPRSGIKDIPDLAKAVSKGTHRCKVSPGSFFGYALLRSSDESFRIIGHSVIENDGDFRNVVEILQERGAVFGATRNNVHLLRDQYFISEDTFFSMLGSVAYRNDFCCEEELRTAIFRATAAGLFEKASTDSSFYEHVPYLLKAKEPESKKKLSLGDLAGAFAIVICGNGVACLVFLLEVISKRGSRCKSRIKCCKI